MLHVCMVPRGFQSALNVSESEWLGSWELAPCCRGKSKGLSWVSHFPSVTEGFMAGIRDCTFVVQGSAQLEGTSRDGDNGVAWISVSRAARGLRGTAGSREQHQPQTPVSFLLSVLLTSCPKMGFWLVALLCHLYRTGMSTHDMLTGWALCLHVSCPLTSVGPTFLLCPHFCLEAVAARTQLVPRSRGAAWGEIGFGVWQWWSRASPFTCLSLDSLISKMRR